MASRLGPHLRYLRYVLLHKFYVFRAGLALMQRTTHFPLNRVVWVWRLLVHDLSKFSRAEWGPYVETFYGAPSSASDGSDGKVEARIRHMAFQRAWLHHIHANPHHWQHHILHEDSGKTITLIPPAIDVYEMVADWLAAGPKALTAHTMADAVAETIVWYAKMRGAMLMRDLPRDTAESLLHELATYYGIAGAAKVVMEQRAARARLAIPGR